MIVKSIKEKNDCCGCTACANVCNHGALSMQKDALGFSYPVVNEDCCTNCGLCEQVCAFTDHYSKSDNLPVPQVYAVRHKKKEELETSRSGGMFVAVADWVFSLNGVVYGAGYTDAFKVVHKRASTKEEYTEFKGSKYVQSDLEGIFRQVKGDLKKGIPVLFTGTPCQTAGLRSYLTLLKVPIANLYLCDIVCHGVPSPSVWQDYLSFLEKKHGDKITAVNFRDKTKLGWASHQESFRLSDRIVYEGLFTDLFYKNIMLGEGCGNCHYCNLQRPSDITLGDFWGWEKVSPNFNIDNKGVSLVLLNTSKGVELFDRIKDELTYVQTDTNHCLQPNLQHPSIIHPYRCQFEKEYSKHDFLFVLRKYGKYGWRYQLRRIVRKIERISKKIVK